LTAFTECPDINTFTKSRLVIKPMDEEEHSYTTKLNSSFLQIFIANTRQKRFP